MRSGMRYCVALCATLALTSTSHAETLRIGSWEHKTDPLTVGSEAVLALAYAEAKQPVEFIDLPIRRAMSMLLNNELDGNLHRTAAIGQEQPGLVRIQTPINAMVIRMYAHSATLNPASWHDLSGMRVAYRRGVIVIETHLGPRVVRVEAKSDADALRMAAVGAVDVALAAEPMSGLPRPDVDDGKLRRLKPVLITVPLYHYLLKRHAVFADRLDAILRRLQQSGQSDIARRHAVSPPSAP